MKAIIMAAGKGKRLRSEETKIPKCMVRLAGKPLISYVLEYSSFIPREDKIIVIGFFKEAVEDFLHGYPFAVQHTQRGTGDAVNAARELLSDYDGEVFVLSGDMPMIRSETLSELAEAHSKNANDCTILSYYETGELPPFGRIIRNGSGEVADIRELRDANDGEREIRELNSGVYIFNSKKLFECLKKLEPSEVTGEYYLTDVPKIMLKKSWRVGALCKNDPDEFRGVNDFDDLAALEELIEARKQKNIN